VGAALDTAVFAGTGKRASWPEAIVPAAVAAGTSRRLATRQPKAA
jgi:hypothetical protein